MASDWGISAKVQTPPKTLLRCHCLCSSALLRWRGGSWSPSLAENTTGPRIHVRIRFFSSLSLSLSLSLSFLCLFPLLSLSQVSVDPLSLELAQTASLLKENTHTHTHTHTRTHAHTRTRTRTRTRTCTYTHARTRTCARICRNLFQWGQANILSWPKSLQNNSWEQFIVQLSFLQNKSTRRFSL